jgi:hypothetical protein
MQLVFLPKGVVINEINKSITLKFFIFKSQIISIGDIDKYNTIIIVTRSSRYDGVLIKLKSGKGVVLSDSNLRECKPIKDFLEKFNVLFDGHNSKFNFIGFFKNNYKNNSAQQRV